MSAASPNGQTTDLTPLILPDVIGIDEDSVNIIRGFIMASDHGGNVAAWTLNAAVRRVGTGAPAGIGAPIKIGSTAGATTWTAVMAFDGNDVRVQVTGGLVQTVDWRWMILETSTMLGPIG